MELVISSMIGVDFCRWLKVTGTNNVFSIGDCAFILDNNLPATAQVASQEGAYLGRLFSKNYLMKTPSFSPPIKLNISSSENDEYFSEKLRFGGLGVDISENEISANKTIITEIARPFQFLNLGVLAYIGASKALAQVSVDDKNILGSGTLGFLLWRGIYWYKQVSWRNRVLVGIDWIKARLYGRDLVK